MIAHRDTGHSRGFGFVKMATGADAKVAIDGRDRWWPHRWLRSARTKVP